MVIIIGFFKNNYYQVFLPLIEKRVVNRERHSRCFKREKKYGVRTMPRI